MLFQIIYRSLILGYAAVLRAAAALGNTKAKLWLAGRKNWRSQLPHIPAAQPVLWLHAASLGEFEQGRPIIEAFRTAHPDWCIVLTFFSPSGYTVRQNYAHADHVLYLPLDSPRNARDFVTALHPSLVIFVKYEFWYFYLRALFERNIPTLLVSAAFRRQQLFFKWYGRPFLRILGGFRQIFVQTAADKSLLLAHGIAQVTHAGDTRLDRSAQVAAQAPALPFVPQFCGAQPVLVAGSTWLPDEQVIAAFLRRLAPNGGALPFKLIIAPHEINTPHLQRLQTLLQPYTTVLYADAAASAQLAPDQLASAQLTAAQVLIIDNVGMLAHLYQYARYAYIGGAFGGGLHNSIEAAAFGIPIFFGNKNYQKFGESLALIAAHGAWTVADANDLYTAYNALQNPATYQTASDATRNYVTRNSGATALIMHYLAQDILS